MKNIYLLSSLIITFLWTFSACTKYEPIYGVAGHVDNKPLTLKNDLVYIYKNDIYMTNEIFSSHKRLTTSSTSTKTHVAFSPKHDKVAYLNANGTPVVIDTSGNQLEVLTSYTGVKDLKWHANNGNPTLYFLVNNTIVFHGSSLSINSQPFNFVFPFNTITYFIDAVEIDEDLNIAFTYRYLVPNPNNSNYRDYYHGLAINYDNGSDFYIPTNDGNYLPTSSTYSAQYYPYYHSISFDKVNHDLLLGYIINNRQNDYLYYKLYRYNYDIYSLSLHNSSMYYANAYLKNNKGYTLSDPSQLKKYLNVLPPGVPAPTGTANTFDYIFASQNTTVPTYFDWKP